MHSPFKLRDRFLLPTYIVQDHSGSHYSPSAILMRSQTLSPTNRAKQSIDFSLRSILHDVVLHAYTSNGLSHEYAFNPVSDGLYD